MLTPNPSPGSELPSQRHSHVPPPDIPGSLPQPVPRPVRGRRQSKPALSNLAATATLVGTPKQLCQTPCRGELLRLEQAIGQLAALGVGESASLESVHVG